MAAAGLAFVGKGSHMVSAGQDAAICFWTVSTESAEKFSVERCARLHTAYAGGAQPAQQLPVNVRACSLSSLLAEPPERQPALRGALRACIPP